MAEPKKRLTKHRSGNRQSHDALKSTSLMECSNCKAKVEPHTACQNCGYYRGKKVLVLKDEKKAKAKETQELSNE